MKQHLILFFNFLVIFFIFSCKEDPNRHLNLGNWYLQKGLLDEAIIEYREVSRLYSGDKSRLSRDEYEALGKAHFKLAIAYTEKGSLIESFEESSLWWEYALSEAKKSFEILPNKKSHELVNLIEAKLKLNKE